MEDSLPVPPPDLLQALTDALESDYESRDKDMRLWASDLGTALGPDHGGACPLAFWRKCRNAPRKEPGPGQMLMYHQGNALEEVVIDMLRRKLPLQGWMVDGVQIRASTERIGGRLDIRLRWIRDPEVTYLVIVDVKTKRGGAFRYLDKPKPGDVLQVQYYMKEEDADLGMLIYVDREGQNFARQFVVERADERVETAIQRLEELRDGPEPPALTYRVARRENKGPDSIYINWPWQIEWCDLQECPCAKSCPRPPDKIVAKITDEGDVIPQPGMEEWQGHVTAALLEQEHGE